MNVERVGVCGLLCSACEAFLATEADDSAEIEAIAERWSATYGRAVSADAVWCTGCVGPDPRKCGHTEECEIRACALERGLESCADCYHFACDRLETFLVATEEMGTRERLEGMRPIF